ncbi:MAG: M20/M25/M40 family metallo-hydrolase, partial [Gemmatimonadetes bacterium]|nr:M20/M25/M40 family metallo-hydrolase [Gemmatimonadota bacterium]
VAELDAYQRDVLAARTHPLLGRPSFHASLIDGGIGLSTYPDRCSVRFERRTITGERAEDFAAEVQAAIVRVQARRPELRADVLPGFAQGPNDVPASHAIVRALADALAATSLAAPIEGLSCWTDAALLTAAGVPAICFGPGDIGLAHAAAEYVPVHEIEQASAALESLVRSWCGSA